MKSRNNVQKTSKQSVAKGAAGIGKKLRRISISDDSDSANSADVESQMPEFLDLQEFDLLTKCPTFKSVLDRDSTHSSTVNADELDSLQFELERLLFHIIGKSSSIANSLADVNDIRGSAVAPLTSTSLRSASTTNLVPEKKTSKVKFSSVVTSPATPVSTAVELPSKRTALLASLSPLKIKPPKLNRTEHVTTSERSALSPGSSRMYLWPQNQMPDKFVNFIDHYAGRIPTEVVSKLKHFADESDRLKSSQYYEIPDLGKHYSLRKSEQPLSPAESSHKSSGNTHAKDKMNNKGSSKISAKAKNGEIDQPSKPARLQSTRLSSTKSKGPAVDREEEQFSLGPLTERLVQALIEEDAFEPDFDEKESDFSIHNGASSPPSTPSKNLLKSLNLGNMAALERRIRKELEQQGLLNFDEPDCSNDTFCDPEDEVLTELRQRQKELESLQKVNSERLHCLIPKCENVLERQNVEDRLKSSDEQVLDLFSRFYGITPVIRKPSSKKEKDQVWKSLKDREKLVEELKHLRVT